MATIAFRSDEDLEQKLRAAARREKKTKTEIIREALSVYLAGSDRVKSEGMAHRGTAAEVLKDFIGVWDGPADTSVRAGRTAGEYLLEKHRTRRV